MGRVTTGQLPTAWMYPRACVKRACCCCALCNWCRIYTIQHGKDRMYITVYLDRTSLRSYETIHSGNISTCSCAYLYVRRYVYAYSCTAPLVYIKRMPWDACWDACWGIGVLGPGIMSTRHRSARGAAEMWRYFPSTRTACYPPLPARAPRASPSCWGPAATGSRSRCARV